MTMATAVVDSGAAERRDALVARLFDASAATLDIFSTYIGLRLGLYQALAAGLAMTSTQLAAATGTNERYVREWLEHRATTGPLAVDDPAAASLAVLPTRRVAAILARRGRHASNCIC
jgi:hypothetical protein